MNKLYEIADDYQECLAEYQRHLAEAEDAFNADEITQEEVEARYDEAALLYGEYMTAVAGDFSAKAENTAKVIRNLEAERDVAKAKAAPFQEEARRYAARAAHAEVQVKHLKAYLLNQLVRMDLKKTGGDDLKVARQINGQPSIVCMSMGEVPSEYRIPQPDLLDSGAIQDAWRDAGKPGEPGADPAVAVAVLDDIPGVEIRRGQHVRIR